jgi:hypothetical protein
MRRTVLRVPILPLGGLTTSPTHTFVCYRGIAERTPRFPATYTSLRGFELWMLWTAGFKGCGLIEDSL